jgi:hypothetical protein
VVTDDHGDVPASSPLPPEVFQAGLMENPAITPDGVPSNGWSALRTPPLNFDNIVTLDCLRPPVIRLESFLAPRRAIQLPLSRNSALRLP